MNAKLLIFSNLLVTFYLIGLVWLIQVVQYPGFDKVGTKNFHAYHEFHVSSIFWVVAMPMVIELILSLGLLITRPPQVDMILNVFLFVLVLVVWGVTFFVAIPLHNQLADGGLNADITRKLTNINWIRTIAWTLRGVVLAYIIYDAWE
ncbi:MAG TPA: hypothetical protein DCS93_26050 [Microscillaceae bacterium]|nr:hypothetical protein [Microscillaceae bacterium]